MLQQRCGGGGYLLRAVLGGEQPVLLREHQPLPLAGHLGRARVTCHVSRGTPAPTFLPLPILSISCEVEDSFLTADMAAGSDSSTRASLALSCRGSDTEILDWLTGCCPLVARVTAMDQLPGLLSWSWSLYTRHEVSTSTLIFMATTSSRRQRGARLL